MDFIQPTPRNYLMGLLADKLQGGLDFATSNGKNKPMNMLAELLGVHAIQKTADRISYGEPLTTGRGYTTQMKPETFDAAVSVLPFAKPMAKGAGLLAEGLGALEGSKALQSLSKSSPMADRGAIVWHGSPHKFPPTPNNPLGEFDFTKIGTGEGAQAYGHGGYLDGNKKVGEIYRDNRSALREQPGMFERLYKESDGDNELYKQIRKMTLDARAANNYASSGKYENIVSNAINKGIGLDGLRDVFLSRRPISAAKKTEAEDYLRAINEIEKNSILLEQINKFKTSSPSLYKVDLPDEHIAKMLDWDKPLSSENINALRSRQMQNAMADSDIGFEGMKLSGNELYNRMAIKIGHPQTAKAMQEAGITGIKYLDGGSRAAGAGSQNFVVFPGNERLLKILERNGQKQ